MSSLFIWGGVLYEVLCGVFMILKHLSVHFNFFLFLGAIYFVQSENLASPKCEARLKSAFFNMLRRLEEHFSPFALFYVDFGPLFARVFGVV